MKKKKFLSLAMVAVMTAAMSLSALADVVKVNSSEFTTYGNVGDPTLQPKDGQPIEQGDQAGLGPAKPIEDYKDTSGWKATFDIDVEGDYTFKFCYTGAASGDAVRKFSYKIDDGDRFDVALELTDSWKTADAKVKEVTGVHLTAGKHEIKMGPSTDFNDLKTAGGVKTPNIIYFSYEAENPSAGTENPDVDPVTPDEPVELPDPVAAYDFTGSKLSDTSKSKLPDLTLVPDVPENDDDWRRAQTSARAEATVDGIKIANGFVRLPDNLFSNIDESKITGITVSMTVKLDHDAWDDANIWSQHLFDFSSSWLPDSGKRADASFYSSRNGNVGTAKNYYGNNNEDGGSWLDGSLDPATFDEWHTVTVTYDIATNTVVMYRDGEKMASSADVTNWEVKASLTAKEIKSLTANAIGLPCNGGWGYWGFFTVKNFNVYTSALNAKQVAALLKEDNTPDTPDTPNTPDNPSPGTDDPVVDDPSNPSAGTDDPNVDPANPGDGTGDGNTTDPATGDKAPIVPFAIAAVLAVAVMGCVVVLKKRNA